MTTKEYYPSDINAGKAMCQNCKPSYKTLFMIHHGYGESEVLSPEEEIKLDDIAFEHEYQTGHETKVIIFQR